MKARGFLVCAMLVALCGAAHAGTSPADAAREFYRVYVQTRPSGIPDAKARAKFLPFITGALNRALADGAQAEARYAKATKNEVPPLVEGDLFSSLFEGATSYSVDACTEKGTRAQCAVRLRYAPPGDKPAAWTDQAVLVREKDGWRLDDIIFGGTWDFSKRGRLSQVLKDAVAESRKPVD